MIKTTYDIKIFNELVDSKCEHYCGKLSLWSGKRWNNRKDGIGYKYEMILMLLEDKAGKNLHLEHIEDEILNFGVDGGRGAINFVRSLRDMLSGNSRSEVNMTVKWDGAPAIFAGKTQVMVSFLLQRNQYSMSILNYTNQMQR